MVKRVTANHGIVGGRRLVLLLLLVCGVAVLDAQDQATCNSARATKAGKACASPKTPGVSEQFPYPGETTASQPGASSTPAVSAPSSAKDRFPYPGEANGSDPADSGASKAPTGESSSSSGSDVTPDLDGRTSLKDEGTSGSTARGRRRLRPPAQKILSDDERVEEDLSVAHFYQQSGNLTGAYLRTKDAVKLQPQAADAHLVLAEVAEKMGKRDEAVAEYKKYLELDPDGDGVKTAKKGLEKLRP